MESLVIRVAPSRYRRRFSPCNPPVNRAKRCRWGGGKVMVLPASPVRTPAVTRCPPFPETAGRPARLLPSILIIGERKCGTSSLARYLSMHSHVLPPDTKEPAFLTQTTPSKGAYAQHFPLAGTSRSCIRWYELVASGRVTAQPLCKVAESDCPPLTFDASAGYFSEAQPHVVVSIAPRAKALVLLRAPHARAFSHWRMHRRFMREGRRNYHFVTNFSQQISSELDRLRQGAKGPVWRRCTLTQCPHTPYVGPGLLYGPRVAHWTAHGNPLWVLFTEEMDEATAKGPRALVDYLAPALRWCGLEPSLMGSLLRTREPMRSNVASWVSTAAAEVHPAATRATLAALVELYQQPNRALAQRVGRQHLPEEWAAVPEIA